jgi:hypothetical protein
MAANFNHEEYVFFNMLTSLPEETAGFTSLSKEVVLRIFITQKNPSSSAGFEPAKLGCSGKHANQ